MFFQFVVAVRAAFRVRYEIVTAPLGTILHFLNAVYIKSSWMAVHGILRATANFRVIYMYLYLIL
jgi:hypothetical protein